MAAVRDQAARIIRTEPETAGGDAAGDTTAQLADRTHVAEETRRRPAETPGAPATEKPAAPSADAAKSAAPKSSSRERSGSPPVTFRVTIPMEEPVESLNSAVAAALCVYEARRQRVRP